MLTPAGLSAENMDKIMLMATWVTYIEKKESDSPYPTQVIHACMGKPTYPIPSIICTASVNYFENLSAIAKYNKNITDPILKAINDSKNNYDESTNDWPVLLYDETFNTEANFPNDSTTSRKKMADALSKWYETEIHADNIKFTVGAAGSLRIIFKLINDRKPHGRIITPFPHYPLHAQNGENNLHPIKVMHRKGYRLTLDALEKSIDDALFLAKFDSHTISAFLFCNPHNPLGTVLSLKEWDSIANVLRCHPDTLIVIDEAYAEMQLNGKKSDSLLQVAPDLKERIIIIRSATKGFSAAGTRMAVTIAFDKRIMADLIEISAVIGTDLPFPPQAAYAEAMSKLNETELKNIALYYGYQVRLVENKLKAIGANMPDPHYNVEGSFYVLADLSELLGIAIPAQVKLALGEDKTKITSDEDIAYYLLFAHKLAIAPLSYFGLNPSLGYMRITCSSGPKTLNELLKRLEICLHKVRLEKINFINEELTKKLLILKELTVEKAGHIEEAKASLLATLHLEKISANELKNNMKALTALHEKAATEIKLANASGTRRLNAATTIQKMLRGYIQRQKSIIPLAKNKWANNNLGSETLIKDFQSLSALKKQKIPFWRQYLNGKKPSTDWPTQTEINNYKLLLINSNKLSHSQQPQLNNFLKMKNQVSAYLSYMLPYIFQPNKPSLPPDIQKDCNTTSYTSKKKFD